jgi:hypothetical protein
MSRWRPWIFGLIALGWAFWLVCFVLLAMCDRFQSGMLAAPGDPCRELSWIVLGGFVFLLVASIRVRPSPRRPRRSEHESREELIQRRIDEERQRQIDEERQR